VTSKQDGDCTNVDPVKEEPAMLPEEQKKAFNRFYRSARRNKILEPKTTLMIHLASAMALACYP
jgi:hypothetical protein